MPFCWFCHEAAQIAIEVERLEGGGFEKSKTNAEFERDLCQAKAWEIGLYIIFVSNETQEE